MDAHIIQMGKLCSLHPWHRVVNYEIAFFHRYYTVQTPEVTWSRHDQEFLTAYLLLPSVGNPMKGHNLNSTSIVCRKFSEGKYCNQYTCRFSHVCTFDQSRCNGAHAASNCPLNPNHQPPPNERQYSRNSSYNRSHYSNNSNPNFTPVKDNNLYNRDRDRNRRDRRD